MELAKATDALKPLIISVLLSIPASYFGAKLFPVWFALIFAVCLWAGWRASKKHKYSHVGGALVGMSCTFVFSSFSFFFVFYFAQAFSCVQAGASGAHACQDQLANAIQVGFVLSAMIILLFSFLGAVFGFLGSWVAKKEAEKKKGKQALKSKKQKKKKRKR